MGVEKIGETRIIRPVKKVGISASVDESLYELLQEQGLETTEIPGGLNSEDLIRTLTREGIHVVAARTDVKMLDEKIWQACPELTLVMGACRDPHVNAQAAINAGTWTLRANVNTENVATDVMGVINGLSQGYLQGATATRNLHGAWFKREIGRDLFDPKGKTIGIVGFGEIGFRVAQKAMAQGMNVVFYNDGSRTRRYDHTITARAAALQNMHFRQGPTINRLGSMEELAGNSDILTIHTSSQNWEGNRNSGVVTLDHLRRLGAKKDGLGICINYGRAQFVGAAPQEILKLLEHGDLRYFVTDVFSPDVEHDGDFRFPVDVNHPAAWRFIGSPHLGGTSPFVDPQTALDLSSRLLPQWEQGRFGLGDSPLYPRHSLDGVSYAAGDIVVTITTSTRRGMNGQLGDLFNEMGLNVNDLQAVADKRDGTKVDHGTVPRTVVLNKNGGDRPDLDVMKDVTDGLLDLGEVKTIRFIPTTDEQTGLLNNPNTKLTTKIADPTIAA